MEPITAAHLRALLVAIDAVCPGGLQAPAGGSLHLDLLGAGGGLLATLTRRELEQAARRGCSRHPDGTCRCPLVRRPARTDTYTPTAAQRRWGSARDHGCRHPGCRFPLYADGALLVTTPGGVTRISRPPGSYLLEPFELGASLPELAGLDPAPF